MLAAGALLESRAGQASRGLRLDDELAADERPYSPGSKASSPAKRRSPWSTAPTAGCCIAAIRSASSYATARTRRSPNCCGPALGRTSRSCMRAADGRGRRRPACAAADRPPNGRAAHRRCRFGAQQSGAKWPPTADQARALTAMAPSALAAFARLRRGDEPSPARPFAGPGGGLPLPAQRRATRPCRSPRAGRLLHRSAPSTAFNASTFTARVITSTQSDMASAVAGAIGALKGPLHGGAPGEVVNQLLEIGSPEQAEQWIRDTIGRGERIMGFGHRVYRAYDPRAAALRDVARGMAGMADWLEMAVAVEDVVLRSAGRDEARPGHQDQRRVLRRGRAAGRGPAARSVRRPRSRWRVMPAGRRTCSSRPARTV